MPYAMTLSGAGPSCAVTKKAGRSKRRACICTDAKGRKKFAKLERCGLEPSRKRR